MDMEQLSAAVQDLVDRRDILACVNLFNRGIDRLDREMMLSCFHADAVDDHVMIVDHPEEFVDWAINLHTHENVSTTHFVTNHVAEIDGDTAHAETYVLSVGVMNDVEQPLPFIGGRYVDRLTRRDGRWAIEARVCVIHFVSEVPALHPAWEQLLSTGPKVARDKTDVSYMRPLVVREPGYVDLSVLGQ